MKALISSISVAVLVVGLFSSNAVASTISILDIGHSGTTADGTIFMAEPNPSNPSTGTGVFQPFLRIGAGNGALYCVTHVCAGTNPDYQLGFNTDAKNPDINFDTKNGSNWTRSVLFNELGVINGYYVLSLDANQLGKGTSLENRITLTDMQIYIGTNPNLANPEATNTGVDGTGYTGAIFNSSNNGLVGLTPVWSMDNALNGDVSVTLQASICDSKGQCGSGHGDLNVLIPQHLLSGSGYFVLYTEYSGANDGFEEWRFNSASTSVQEPSSLLLLGSGLIGIGLWGRKHKNIKRRRLG